MTIEEKSLAEERQTSQPVRRSGWQTFRAILIGAPLVLLAWGVSMVGITLLQAPGKPVAVLAIGGMEAALAAVIASDGYILQVKGNTVIAISDKAGFVQRLYHEGALIVVAASTGGCIVAPSSTTVVRSPVVPAPAV